MKEFFVAVVNNSGLTLHIRQLDGVNSLHRGGLFQGLFQGVAMATEIDPRRAGAIPSRGVLEQAGAS